MLNTNKQTITSFNQAIAAAEAKLAPARIWLAQRKKIVSAIEELARQQEQAKTRLQKAYAAAGNAEASRLLGEETDKDAARTAKQVTEAREEFERLQSAGDVLQAKLQELELGIEDVLRQAGQTSGELFSDICMQLQSQVDPVAVQMDRLRQLAAAIGHAIGRSRNGFDDLENLRLDNLVTGEALFQATSVLYATDTHPDLYRWKGNEEAAALHESLLPAHYLLRDLQRIDETVKGRMESEEQTGRADAA